jgi:class 3 adenylate cyclase
MFAFKSILMRLIVMLILPIALFLTVTSILEYVYIRTIILKEWQESTSLRLERASHQIDLRLSRVLAGMQAFAQTGGTPLGDKKQERLLNKLQAQEGVKTAGLIWKEPGSETRTKYGSAANLAHRIQSQAQPGEVVVSKAIYRLTHDAFDVTRVIPAHLKGVEEMVTLYAVQECRDPSPEPQPRSDL